MFTAVEAWILDIILKTEIPYGELLFVVEGRCDGLLVAEDNVVTIDEIKSTARDVESLSENMFPVH